MRLRLERSGGEVRLLGMVHGLISEAERARGALHADRPTHVGLGVSPQGAEELARYEPSDETGLLAEMPEHDVAYQLALTRFGVVSLPPPDLLALVREAPGRGAHVVGLDLEEDAYEDAFTEAVSTWDFLKMGRVQKRLIKRPPEAQDARAFALAWDAEMRRVAGMDTLERLREKTIAQNARALLEANPGARLLLVVDVAREEGVLKALLAEGLTRT